MEDLYAIKRAENKGLGWFATRKIRAGTLLCREKSIILRVDDNQAEVNSPHMCSYKIPVHNWIETYSQLSKKTQNQFMKLSNMYNDLSNISKRKREPFLLFARYLKNHDVKRTLRKSGLDQDVIYKMWCIRCTNAFGNGYIGINVSRINHSCVANASIVIEDDYIVVRSSTKIREGEEIFINYMTAKGMQDLSARQKFCQELGFICTCENCQTERKKPDSTYDDFNCMAKKSVIANRISQDDSLDLQIRIKFLTDEISYNKRMYKAAKAKRAPIHLLYKMCSEACERAKIGIILAKSSESQSQELHFQKEYVQLMNASLKIAKITYGNDHNITRYWENQMQNEN